MIIVIAANAAVFGALGFGGRLGRPAARSARRVRPGRARRQPHRVRRSQLGVGRCRGPGRRGRSAGTGDGAARALWLPGTSPRPESRVRRSPSVTSRSATPAADRAVLSGLDLTVPAGTSLAIVGQNGAGKTTLAKLLCRLYDPNTGAIKVDGVDLRGLEPGRLAAPDRRGLPGLCPLRAVPARERRPRPGGQRRRHSGGAGRRRRREPCRARHPAGQGIPQRHRPLGWSVAAGCAGAGAVRRTTRRRAGAARRADSTARCPRRGRGLRQGAAGNPRRHHDLDLAPVLHRAARGPDLRSRARPS